MKVFFITSIFLLISISLSGSWVEVNEASPSGLFKCEQQGRSAAEVEFKLDGFELELKEYAGETYTVITHEEAGKMLDIGLPDLPVFTKALIIPDEGTPTLEIISFEQREFKDVMVYPQEVLQFEHEAAKDNFTINREFYQGRSIYPAEIAWVGEPAIMRDIRVLPVTFSPFSYDTSRRTLTVYSNIVVEVTVTGSGGINARYRSGKRSRAFEAMYRANTLNYDQLGYRDEYQVPAILFICDNNDDVLENLAYLTEWKKQKGFNVVVATTAETGTSNISIKDYIQDAYDNWEIPPEYVNIMGDGNGAYMIETWYNTSGEGDHPYSQLEGADVLGDIILGRMTFNSIASLQTVISKAISYETNPFMGQTDWYQRALLTGDPSYSGYSCISVMQSCKEMMLDYPGNFFDDDNFVEVYNSPFSYLMNTAINQGVSYFGYRGYYGTSGWTYGTTTNGYMLPFAVIPTCGSNNWQSGTGNAEGFYQMGTTTLPGGGIGALGTATSGTHTPFNNAIALGICGGIFRDNINMMGGAVLQGKYYLWLSFPQNPSNYVGIFSHWNTLMGDGSLELWTGIPRHLSVTYDGVIPTGANYCEVTVLDSTGNAAVGAWVTIYSGINDYSVSDFCDENGSVILEVAHIPEGSCTLTVTCHNHIPYQHVLTKEQLQQFVDIQTVEYLDTGGNGNGIVNPGETVELIVSLANRGRIEVSGVTASMSCSSTEVNIITSVVNFGDIGCGELVIPDYGFEMEFVSSIPGGVEILTEFTITDDDGHEWITWLTIPVAGVSLYAAGFSIADDGILDPGETTEIYISLENIGELEAAGVNGELLCSNYRITINDGLGSFGSIPPGGTGDNSQDTFTVTASGLILPGSYFPFVLNLTDENGYDSSITVNIPVGEPEVNDPYGPDEYGYWCYDDGDWDYDECPVYNWVEIDPLYGGRGTSISWEGGTGTGTAGGTGNYANLTIPEEFSFVFYGVEYEEFCVCTNGWIAPGFHETGSFMNYQIPGPQGPSPMIAVFWDDLNIGSGDVLWSYNEELHFLTVEWSRIFNGDTGAGETFQVILYDSEYYQTTTGDSKIKMQYLDVTNDNYGTYPSNHGQYCSVGLENEDSQMGLQYTYNNTYPAASKVLEDETALLFMTSSLPSDAPFLRVGDYYAYAGDDYFIEAGETAYISLVLENLGGEAAQDIDVELSLTDDYINMLDAVENWMEVPANGAAVLHNSFCLEVSDFVPDFYSFNLTAQISCAGNSWSEDLSFTAYWTNVFIVDRDSIYFELQPSETGIQEFTLTNRGEEPVNYYLGIYETLSPVRDISGSNITVNANSFTPGEETTWTFTVSNASLDNEWLSDIWIEFPPGVTVIHADDISGGSGGDMLWDGSAGAEALVNWHGLTSNGWGVIYTGDIVSWDVDVLLSFNIANDIVLEWEIGGDGHGVEPHTVNGQLILQHAISWMWLASSSGYLEAGGSELLAVNFDAHDLEESIYTGDIVISCDSWDIKTIPVVLNVEMTGDGTGSLLQVAELTGNYPNPFNPETEICFLIPKAAEVILEIYNVKGQLVRTLADDYFPAGRHALVWNGKDDAGKTVTTGIYFYHLKTDSFEDSGKMVLMK
ncbi:MAG: hypothetical protein K9N06_11685 [Candidatus Cloacimonetes bacterium]|nr:hypothetical protein [Candidatus Cloacimonadota bacterium]